MNWQTNLFFASIVLTCILTGFLAWYAWQRRGIPGVRAYFWLALGECLLALSEILSMLSPNQEQAFFWYQARFLFTATIPVFFLIFALEYNRREYWLSNSLKAGLFVIPCITQFMLWSNHLHGLWVEQEIVFHQSGLFWIAATNARIPGLWFLAHSFYCLLLMLAGIIIFLMMTFRRGRAAMGQGLLLTAGALTGMLVSIIPIFNLLPQAEYNPFVPGIGLSALLYALAIFQFQFMKPAPKPEPSISITALDGTGKHSLARLGFVFILMLSGITAIGVSYYKNFEAQFRRQIENNLLILADLKSEQLVNWRMERLVDADLFYQNADFSGLVAAFLETPQDSQKRASLMIWLEKALLDPEYDRVFLLDAAGEVRISIPATPEPVPFILTARSADSLASGEVVFLDLHRHEDDDRTHMSILVPIYDQQNESHPLGVLVLRIDPGVRLYPLIQRWPLQSASAETLLVRRDGQAALFLNTLRFQEDAALNLRISLDSQEMLAVRAILGDEGILEGMDYRNVPVVADVRPVPGTPWFLISKMDLEEVYAPLRERARQTLILFGTLILAAGAGLGAAWRQQRVRHLRAQVQGLNALRDSEEKFKLAFEISPDAISITRQSDGMFVSVNQDFERITGYTKEEAIGKTSLELNIWKHPEDRKRIIEILLKRGVVHNFEAPFLTRNGEIQGLMSLMMIILDGVPHLLHITRDITARKLAEERLRASEAALQQAQRVARVGSWVWHIQANRVEWSDEMYRIFGIEKEGFTGDLNDLIANAIHPEDRAAVEASNQSVITKNQPIPLEYRILLPDQSIRTVWAEAGELTLDKGGAPETLTGIVQDITERKRAEEAIKESEAFVKTVLDNLPVGVAVNTITPAVEFEYMNDNFPKFYRTTREELADPDAFWATVYQDPKFREEIKNRVLEDTASGDPERMLWSDIPITRKGEGTFYVTARNIPVPGRPSIISTVWDVTERKRAEQEILQWNAELEERVAERTRELQAAQEQLIRQERLATLGQVAGSIGHELRNPLGVISNAIYFLKLTQPDASKKVKEYLEIIENETRISDRIVTDLLDFTRIKSLERQPVTILELVNQTLARYPAPLTTQTAIEVPKDLPNGFADPRHAKQVLGNLVTNAYQAMPEGGKLTIRAGVDDDMIFISVLDTGAGIPPENLDKIFEPLFTTKSRGIGLGLAVCQKLAEANAGRIEVQSQPGEGSIFKFFLPIHTGTEP